MHSAQVREDRRDLKNMDLEGRTATGIVESRKKDGKDLSARPDRRTYSLSNSTYMLSMTEHLWRIAEASLPAVLGSLITTKRVRVR